MEWINDPNDGNGNNGGGVSPKNVCVSQMCDEVTPGVCIWNICVYYANFCPVKVWE